MTNGADDPGRERRGIQPRHWRMALGHPAVKLPLTVAALLVAVLVLSRRLSVVLLLALAFLGLSAAVWAFVAWRVARRGASPRPESTGETATHPAENPHADLATQLAHVARTSDLRAPARQALRQLHLVDDKLAAIRANLSTALSPEELTYARYRAAAEAVGASIVAQVAQVARNGTAAAAIDARYARRQLSRLSATLTPAAEMERQALVERLRLRENACQTMDELVSKNEEALTALARLAMALDGFTRNTPDRSHIEAHLQDLEELAARVRLYASEAPADRDHEPVS